MLKRLLLVAALLFAPIQAFAVGYTWNATNWTGDTGYWPLSNGNKTATRASGSGVVPIKTNESFNSGTVTEKFTYTTYDGNAGSGSGGIAVANGAWTNSSSAFGGDVNSIVLTDDGTGSYNGAALASGARLPGNVAFTSGGTYWIEVNYTAKTVRFSADGSSWGNTTDVTGMIAANGTLYFGTWGYYANEVVTLSEPTSASSPKLLTLGVGDR